MDYKNDYVRKSPETTSCLVLHVVTVTELTRCVTINGFQIMMCTNCQHTFFPQT